MHLMSQKNCHRPIWILNLNIINIIYVQQNLMSNKIIFHIIDSFLKRARVFILILLLERELREFLPSPSFALVYTPSLIYLF